MASEFDDLIPSQPSRQISDDTLRKFGFDPNPPPPPPRDIGRPGGGEFSDLVVMRERDPIYGSLMAEPTAGRSRVDVVNDTALALREGARNVTSGTLGLPVNIANLATNPIPLRLANAALRALGLDEAPTMPTLAQPDFVRGTQEQLRATNAEDFEAVASPRLHENRAALGKTDGIADTIGLLLSKPEILADVGLGQVGQVLNVVPGAGAGANITAGALSAAGQQADQTAADLAADATLTPEQRAQRESDAFAASLALNALLPQLPGAQTIERSIGNKLAGEAGESTLAAATRALFGEAAQGAASEAGDQAIQNVATGRPIGEGVGQQAAIGALLEGPLGAGAGAAENLAARSEARGAAGNVPADTTSMIQALLQQPAAPAPAAVAPTESAPPPTAPSPARDAEPAAPAAASPPPAAAQIPVDERWQRPVTPPQPAAPEDVSPSSAAARDPAGTGAGAAAPLRSEAQGVEPPVPPGVRRVYHSGSVGEGDTGRWVSTDRRYASDYRSDLPLHYVDLPANDERVNNADYPEQGRSETFNFELSPEEAARLTPISRESSPTVEASPQAPAAPSPESPPAAATSTESLEPRAPAPATPPAGATRAELVQQWRDAKTDDAKAAIAAQIAGMDADATDNAEASQPQPSRTGLADIVDVQRGDATFKESAGTRAAVDAAVQSGNARELVEAVSRQPGISPEQMALARKLAPIIDSLGVKVVAAPKNATAGGAYDNRSRTMWIDQALPGVVLHETLHGVTSALLTNPSARKNAQVGQAVREFEDLHRHVQEAAGQLRMEELPPGLRSVLEAKQGPLSNTKELLTYGMTDTRFQDWLRSLPPPPGRESLRNAWEWFKDAVAKMLGITGARERSALDALIESTGSLVDFAEQNPQATRLAQFSEATRQGGVDLDAADQVEPGIDMSPTTGTRDIKIGDTTIEYGISRGGETGEVVLIRTPPSARENGSARKAMQKFLAAADAAGVTMFLTPEPMGKGGASKAALQRFYKTLGFRDNTGRRADFRSRQAMVRDPVQSSEDFAARTPNDAYSERQTLMGKLAAQGYAQGNALQPQPGGKFVKAKESLDIARTKLQDKMLPLLRAQEAAAGGGKAAVSTVNLNDAMNAYREENLMHGRVRNSLDKASQALIDPIQDGLRKAGSSLAEFEDYLYAKAAPERNAEIAKINQALPDAGSGITTKQANDILAGRAPGVYSGATITPARLALFQSLEPHVREMRRQTLANMVQSGRITPALAASLTAKYPNYVAMRGKDDVLDAQRGGGTGKGLSQGAGSRIKRALGRGDQNIPQNVLGEMVGDLQRSIVDREKGKVADAFLKFAVANPQPDLYTVEPVDLEWKYSESTGEAYLGVKRRGEDVDNTLIVQHDGKPVMIRMVDERLRDAMMNVSANDMQALVRWLGALNRWRSMVLTQYNPAFGPVNIARDIHFGMVGLAAEQGAGFAARAATHYFPAMAAAFRHSVEQRGDASVPDAQKSYDDWAAEFFEEGAATGYTNVDDVVKLQKNLIHASSSIMKLAADGKPVRATQQALKRAGAPILEAVEHFNGATENALRMAAYIEQRKRGVSRPRAAEYAKNLTINFNRKGQWAGLLNAIYLFYNASIQGTHAVQRVMRNPKVMTYLAGIAGLQAWMASALMGDDDLDGITTWDAIPDYVKRTSLVIPLGGKDYFALPMPFGFNLFSYGGGRLTQRAMLGARTTDPSVASDLAAILFESFVPVPVTKGYGSLFGDQFGFLMGLASNTDDFGAPIVRESSKDYPEPRALLGQVDTPRPYHVAAQMMAKLGGGDLDNRVPPIGWLDVEPEKLEAIVNYMTGGVGQIGGKSKRWIEQLDAGNLEGAYQIVSEMPILSRFIGRANEDRATQQRYYLERGEFQRNMDLIRDRIGKGEDAAKVLEELRNPYTAGLELQRRKKTTRDKDTREIQRRGEVMTDAAGRPKIAAEKDSGAPADVQKDVEKRVDDLNDAMRSLRDPDITNDKLVKVVAGLKAKAYPFEPTLAELGLPDNFTADAEAPTRVRNRAIKLLQQERARTQERTLKSLELERRLEKAGGA